MLNFVPPQNIEIEQSVLAACFVGHMEVVRDYLTTEDLYRTANKEIFKALCDVGQGDLAQVVSRLKDIGKLEQCGGALGISKILDEAPASISVKAHCRILREKTILRNLIEKSTRIIESCQVAEDVEAVLNTAQRSINEIDYERDKGCVSSYSDCVMEVMADLENLPKEHTAITGIPSGFFKLDYITCGFQKTDLIILAARPGMGKTALAINIAESAAKSGHTILVFSLEMSKKQLVIRSISGLADVNSMKFRRGGMFEADWRSITNAASKISDLPIYVDDTASVHHKHITRQIRRFKKKHDLGMVIVDYVSLAHGDDKRRKDLEVGEISGAMKAAAKEFDIPVMILSQLNRKLEDRSNKRPQLSDLRESGALEQDADTIMFIYRDDAYNKDPNNPNAGRAEVEVAKQRHGPTGTADLAWNARRTRFFNLAEG